VLRDAGTREIIGKNQIPRFIFYVSLDELRDLEAQSEVQHVSIDHAVSELCAKYINRRKQTQASIEQFKLRFPELLLSTLVVDVNLTGRIEWVS
jgi:hypothetical protein